MSVVWKNCSQQYGSFYTWILSVCGRYLIHYNHQEVFHWVKSVGGTLSDRELMLTTARCILFALQSSFYIKLSHSQHSVCKSMCLVFETSVCWFSCATIWITNWAEDEFVSREILLCVYLLSFRKLKLPLALCQYTRIWVHSCSPYFLPDLLEVFRELT